MNREDIIRLAREADRREPSVSRNRKWVKCFAALVAEWSAKQEREACAKVCERYWSAASLESDRTATAIAADIRSRGEVKP